MKERTNCIRTLPRVVIADCSNSRSDRVVFPPHIHTLDEDFNLRLGHACAHLKSQPYQNFTYPLVKRHGTDQQQAQVTDGWFRLHVVDIVGVLLSLLYRVKEEKEKKRKLRAFTATVALYMHIENNLSHAPTPERSTSCIRAKRS